MGEGIEMDESALIQAAKQGDHESFNQLVLAYQDLVYYHAWSILGEPDLSEDAAQETFIKAFRGLGGYRGGSFRAWLLRITTNTCYDELRRSNHRHDVEEWLVNDEGEEYDLLEMLPSSELPLDTQVEQSELMAAIQRGLQRLPGEYRAAAVIVDVLGFDYAEAAASLGVPVGTLKSRLARARQGLRQYLLATQPAL
jgi:RNA polymerase sigma factor (sigma-70 family)